MSSIYVALLVVSEEELVLQLGGDTLFKQKRPWQMHRILFAPWDSNHHGKQWVFSYNHHC